MSTGSAARGGRSPAGCSAGRAGTRRAESRAPAARKLPVSQDRETGGQAWGLGGVPAVSAVSVLRSGRAGAAINFRAT